jgi:hypothetical protein
MIHFIGQGFGVWRAGMGGRKVTMDAVIVANTFAPLRMRCFGGQLYEVLVAVFHSHVERKSG